MYYFLFLPHLPPPVPPAHSNNAAVTATATAAAAAAAATATVALPPLGENGAVQLLERKKTTLKKTPRKNDINSRLVMLHWQNFGLLSAG